MLLSVLSMKTTDVPLPWRFLQMVLFQAEKQMFLGSLYHEGHVMHHSFPSCHSDPTVAHYREPSNLKQKTKKTQTLQQWRCVFCCFFGFAAVWQRQQSVTLLSHVYNKPLLLHETANVLQKINKIWNVTLMLTMRNQSKMISAWHYSH